MKNKIFWVYLCLSLAWMFLPGSEATAKEPADALVTVVSLDEHGNPWRQGMGVLVGKDGSVLTSAGLLADSRAGVVKTADGGIHAVRKITCLNTFQDVALLQIEPRSAKIAAVKMASRFQPMEKVWVGVREKAGVQLKEAQLTQALPFSPRLVLLKLEPANLQAEPGSPILNRRGELVGMLHAFAEAQGQRQTYRFFLARVENLPGIANEGKGEEFRWPGEPLKGLDSPGLRNFWEGVGSSLRQEWKKAQEKFSAALDFSGGLAEIYYSRGVARYHLGDWAGAAQDLEEANRRLPGYALAFLWLGKTRERQGNPKAAKQNYERALALGPDLSEAWFYMGKIAYKEGNLGKAKECLERVKGDSSEKAQSWWYLGNIALNQKRSQEALEAFNRAVKIDPGFSQAYLDGGRLLLEDLGRPEEGAVWLREALRLNPRRALTRYYLALAYILSWNRAGAWEQYFALQNENPELAAQLALTFERYH